MQRGMVVAGLVCLLATGSLAFTGAWHGPGRLPYVRNSPCAIDASRTGTGVAASAGHDGLGDLACTLGARMGAGVRIERKRGPAMGGSLFGAGLGSSVGRLGRGGGGRGAGRASRGLRMKEEVLRGGEDQDVIKGIQTSLVQSLKEVNEKEWDACCVAASGEESYNPFLSHAFLSVLEESRSVCSETGWQACHILARNTTTGKLIGAVPLYIKSHSYGEYVFDNSWARAHVSFTGRHYYPKLQSCVPFTPVPGPRLLALGENDDERAAVKRVLARAVMGLSDQLGLSSAHFTFLSKQEWEQLRGEGYVPRVGMQYHWYNMNSEGDKFSSFDEFLGDLRQGKRKNIRQERKKVVNADIVVRRLSGSNIKDWHWDSFYQFYCNTVDSKWGQAYLTRQFFTLLGEKMADKVLLIMAEEKSTGRLVAGALNLIGGDCLYGRNWGCSKQYDSLHFELCYYQAIEAAIERGMSRVEAGAQGQHKISRGYLPSLTYSSHYLRDPQFRDAVREAMQEEQQQILTTTAMRTIQESPFKEDPSTHLEAQGIIIQTGR